LEQAICFVHSIFYGIIFCRKFPTLTYPHRTERRKILWSSVRFLAYRFLRLREPPRARFLFKARTYFLPLSW
jgi:hypothetical protein